jgi:antitoxin component HigA of HigAB toxin-antitoxin module
MSTLNKATRRRVSDDYLDLIRAFPFRTLRSGADHAQAVKTLSRLLGGSEGRMSEGERDYADVLGRLIDDFGQQECPSLPAKHAPLELLRFLMAETGMNTEALGKVPGNKTAASLVLNGKLELSKAHIRRLAEHFKLEAGLFL